MQADNFREALHAVLNRISEQSISFPEYGRSIGRSFVVRNEATNIQIEIQQLEGGVRATGLICLLGAGVGVGSVVGYRFYTTFAKRLKSSENKVLLERPTSGVLLSKPSSDNICDTSVVAAVAETPDSGISEYVTNKQKFHSLHEKYSTQTRRSVGLNQISEWLSDTDTLEPSDDGEVSKIVEDWLATVDIARNDSKLTSWLNKNDNLCKDTSADLKCFSIANISDRVGLSGVLHDGVIHRVSGRSLHEAGLRVSRCKRLRTRRWSFSSQRSGGGFSDYSYHDSLVSKGFSIDLGEDLLAGMITPPRFEEGLPSGLKDWTECSMEKLNDELRSIQRDIDDMNERMGDLRSRDHISLPPTVLTPSMSTPPEGKDIERLSFTPPQGHDIGQRVSDLSHSLNSRSSSANHSYRNIPYRTLRLRCMSDDFKKINKSSKYSESESSSCLRDCSCPVSGSCECDSVNGNDESRSAADFYIDDEMMIVNEEDLISSDMLTPDHLGNHMIDWFDNDTGWDSCDSRMNSFSKSSNESGIRKLRSSSSKSLHENDILNRVNHNYPVRTIADNCDKNHHITSHHSSFTTQNNQTTRPGDSRPGDRIPGDCRPGGSRPGGGCFSLPSRSGDGCRSSPALISRPHSSPVARVKPLTLNTTSSSSNMAKFHSYVSRVSKGWVVDNIGPVLNAHERINAENFSDIYRQQYRSLLRTWNKDCVRVIRADMYCGIRAVLYQSMLQQFPILSGAQSLDHCYQLLSKYMTSDHQYLSEWNFANRLPFTRSSIQMKLAECLHTLFEQVSSTSQIDSPDQREEHLISVFNDNPLVDLKLLEAVKLMMMMRAISMYQVFCSGRQVATSVRQLFSRESSQTIEQLFRNHINRIGDTATIDLVDLTLLGETLSVCIEVGRPHVCDRDQLILSYNERCRDIGVVEIIEENNSKHYTVPVHES